MANRGRGGGAVTKLFVDARCYQDDNYATRGIGRSTIAILAGCPSDLRPRLHLIALTDPAYPEMSPDLSKVFDEVTLVPPSGAERGIFFNPSPLTHPADRIRPILDGTGCLTTAYVHDFIPYDFVGEFQEAGDFVAYGKCLEALKGYGLLYTNSEYTRRRALEILDFEPGRVRRCGISVRPELLASVRDVRPEATAVLDALLRNGQGLFVSVAGDAPRKNIECAVRGVKMLNERLGSSYRLAVIGRYSATNRERIKAIYPEGVVFAPEVSDAALATLLANAKACIIPSRVEGYSMPVMETIAAGGLVVASDCEAHVELLGSREAVFVWDRPEQLADLLGRAVRDPAWRERMIAAQLPRLAEDTEERVTAAFWGPIAAEIGRPADEDDVGRRINIGGDAKPQFAIVSPYPPHRSGVALGTGRLMPSLTRLASADLFTHQPHSVDTAVSGIRKVGTLSDAKSIRGYDAVVYVMGNCNYHHGEIYRLTQHHRAGNHVLLADSVMLNMQYDYRGGDGAVHYAGQILGRPTSLAEYQGWLHRPLTAPLLGQEEFLEEGWKPIVHSQVTKAEIERRSHATIAWVPHPVTAQYGPEHFDAEARRRRRESLCFNERVMNIVSAGSISDVKGLWESIAAIRELSDWSVASHLWLVGGADDDMLRRIDEYAKGLGVAERVTVINHPEETLYRDYVSSGDVGLQLRKVPYGQTSGGLADCIAAGLPTVANETMAGAIEAPSYVVTVPDTLSPVLIARRLIEAFEIRRGGVSFEDPRMDYLAAHSTDAMARGFLQLV